VSPAIGEQTAMIICHAASAGLARLPKPPRQAGCTKQALHDIISFTPTSVVWLACHRQACNLSASRAGLVHNAIVAQMRTQLR